MGNRNIISKIYLNIIVIEPYKTNYIESTFKSLLPNNCNTNNIKSKTLKTFSSLVPFIPTNLPYIEDFMWKFYYIPSDQETSIKDLFKYDLKYSLNNTVIIISDIEDDVKEYLNILYNTIQEELFVILLKHWNGSYNIKKIRKYSQNDLPNSENKHLSFHFINEINKVKLELFKIFCYYNELGEKFAFPDDKEIPIKIKDHIISKNEVN